MTTRGETPAPECNDNDDDKVFLSCVTLAVSVHNCKGRWWGANSQVYCPLSKVYWIHPRNMKGKFPSFACSSSAAVTLYVLWSRTSLMLGARKPLLALAPYDTEYQSSLILAFRLINSLAWSDDSLPVLPAFFTFLGGRLFQTLGRSNLSSWVTNIMRKIAHDMIPRRRVSQWPGWVAVMTPPVVQQQGLAIKHSWFYD